jgi:hypothetical protein
METEDANITICTAPPGLYAVIKNSEMPPDSDMLHTLRVVTAFKYTYRDGAAGGIFSEPLVYCESKDANALVAGKTKIEFVGSHEDCLLKIKELASEYYAEKNSRKNE